MISLWPNGAIAGTVVDERGQPMARVNVVARCDPPPEPDPLDSYTLSATTDESGRYRIAPVPQGQYTVAVVTRTRGGQIPVGMSVVPGAFEAPTLATSLTTTLVTADGHGSTKPSDSQLVDVQSGRERDGIDIRLAILPTVRVSGTVTGPNGPVAHVEVQLLVDGRTVADYREASTVCTDDDGRFTFLAVPVGDYLVGVSRAKSATHDGIVPDGLSNDFQKRRS